MVSLGNSIFSFGFAMLLWGCATSSKPKVEESAKADTQAQKQNIESVNLDSKKIWLGEPDADGIYLVMDKEGTTLTVRSFSYPSKILREYNAISGSKPGDKKVEGDHRTPEGIYFVEYEIPKQRMQALHGAQAFALNYPNAIDRIRKQSGSGIWIHGVDKEDRMSKRFDTRGCVALSNIDVVDLGKRLAPRFKRVPIVIVDAIKAELPIGLLPPESPLIKRINDWVTAWSSKNVESYLSFYSPDFRGRGMSFEDWKIYKTRLAKLYERIDVKINNVRVLQHGKYSIALFEQIYKSDKHQAVTDKRLYLVGEGENAQILSEESLDRKKGPAGSFDL